MNSKEYSLCCGICGGLKVGVGGANSD